MHLDNGDAWGPCWLQNIADTIELRPTKGDVLFRWLVGLFAISCVGGAGYLGYQRYHNTLVTVAQTPMLAAALLAIIGLMAFVAALILNRPALESY